MPKNDTKPNKTTQKAAKNAPNVSQNAPWMTGKVPEIATRPPVDTSPKPAVKGAKPRKPKATIYDPKVKRPAIPKAQQGDAKPAVKKDGKPRKPRYEVTTKHRNRVINGVAQGFSHEDIIAGLGISKTTLYKYYRAEIDHGKKMALMKVGGRLFEAAQRCGDDAAFIPAAKYYENTRGGVVTKTASEVDHKSSDGSMATKAPILLMPE